MSQEFWSGRSVFITGHTGFKGGWTALYLASLGARVYGYSLEPPTDPNFFTATNLREFLQESYQGDIRDVSFLRTAVTVAKPSVFIHMAAQPLVRASYAQPIETFSTNVMGTVNVLEVCRDCNELKAIVNVTTDKCYQNNEWIWPYRENDRLGGHDPYSASKACSELVTATYRNSFLQKLGVSVATARAGNVIGGGDWAPDRLIPDFFRALNRGQPLVVRSPNATRPWQHVLEPVSGYIALAERLVLTGSDYADAWNFGPSDEGAKPVRWILDYLQKSFPETRWVSEDDAQPHEAGQLHLDSSKARSLLGWRRRWSLEEALNRTVDWHHAWKSNALMAKFSLEQIEAYRQA